MKRTIKRLICLLLCIAMVFSFTACEFLFNVAEAAVFLIGGLLSSDNDDGYTGGFPYGDPHAYLHKKICWMETFEELEIVVNGLIAYGNDVEPVLVPKYESEYVDYKYCIIVSTNKVDPPDDDEEWYERNFNRTIKIKCYGFLSDVTIEEIEHSDVQDYQRVQFETYNYEKYDPSQSGTVECFGYYKNSESSPRDNRRCVVRFGDGDDSCYVALRYYGMINHKREIPTEFHDEFAQSLVLLGG